MSQHAPFSDAARSVDETNFSYSFISYYTYGSALALAHGPRAARPVERQAVAGRLHAGDVEGARQARRTAARPRREALHAAGRARSAGRSLGRPAFADEFFSRYVEGREAPDYAKLLAPAGIVVRKRNPGAAWTGLQVDRQNGRQRSASLVAFGTPAFAAGLEEGDVITSIDGVALHHARRRH